jgi:hypothetical protein
MPNVPIVGWDVAFTPQGVFLLEVRLDSLVVVLLWGQLEDLYLTIHSFYLR